MRLNKLILTLAASLLLANGLLAVEIFADSGKTIQDHFYTTAAAERDNATASLGYQDEGICCYLSIQTPNALPLYRLYNPQSQDHFYTTSVSERDNAIASSGYKNEGVCCYTVSQDSADAVPLWRLYNTSTGDHFYTISSLERDSAIAQAGFKDEGVCCYVYPRQLSGTVPLYRMQLHKHPGALAFRAQGQFACINNGSAPIPLDHARVEVWRSGSITNDLMAVGGTNANGEFDIEVWSDDPWVFANMQSFNLHAVGVFDDDYPSSVTPKDTRQKTNGHPVKHINENHSSISFKVSASGPIQNGIKNFGYWTNGTDHNSSGSDNSSHCGIWLLSRDAYVDYINEVGDFPPVKQYDVVSLGLVGTPWTILETTNWPHYYHTGGVNAHEFAHAVRHSFDGDWNHWFSDVVRFRYARNHDPCHSNHFATEDEGTRKGYAFNEGWAEYWEGTVGGCAGVPGVTAGDTTVEGEVARGLSNLANCAGDNNPGKRGMVRVLQKNPGRIHSYAEFEQHFYEEFPNCLGAHRGPVTVGPPTVHREPHSSHLAPPASPAIMESRRQELLATHATITATLARQIEAAKTSAETIAPCRGASCNESVNTLMQHHLLDAKYKIHDLDKQRFQDLVTHSDEIQKTDRTHMTWPSAAGTEYKNARAQIAVASLRNAIRDLESYQQHSPDAIVVSLQLRHELHQLEQTIKQGKAPSLNIEPSVFFESDERVHRVR